MIWLVVFAPLVGAILNGLILPRNHKVLSHVVGAGAVGVAFCASVQVFFDMLSNGASQVYGFEWISAGHLSIPFELVIDRLSGLMLLIVTGIGTLIHIYAGGYMHEEARTYRFFSYLNLFVFMMLLLVLGNNMGIMFVGWEGVGLCSYLLIGYWFSDDANAAAGMKAFLVNRIGDIGFLIGMFLTYQHFGTLSFTKLAEIVSSMTSVPSTTAWAIGMITLCMFIGACGKSAQLPLYVWLPDAMAGPTPVSALIHAATMVTAGIYMMTRMHFFYYLAPDTMQIVAIVGAATALFAATIALVQRDIKKVLAYSTVSQLGYMVLACGTGAFDAATFHLFTHACFKALLFLGAGSVIVAMHHKQDMFDMGGLKKYMPVTHAVFVIGVLAIIGFPGLAGFFSKDEILWKAFTVPGIGPGLWLAGVIAAGCTSFYMVRLLCLTFYGPNRSDSHTRAHLHETPSHMWGPLVILAILSAGVGYLGVPHIIGGSFGFHNYWADYFHPFIAVPAMSANYWDYLTASYSHSLEWGLMGVSVLVMAISSGYAIWLYRNGPSTQSSNLKNNFSKAHKLLTNKYWVDEIYAAYVVKPLEDVALFLWKIVDVKAINGLINSVGHLCVFMGGIASFRMTGSVHRYALNFSVALIFLFFVVWL